MDILYILAALIGVVALQAALIRRFAMRGITYTRTFSRPAAFVGETVEMVEVLRNRKLLPLPWLWVESRMSHALHFTSEQGSGSLRETDSDALFHRSVFYLAPFSQVTRRHTVRLERRGRFAVGSVALRAGDLFGMANQMTELDTGAAITIYPRLLSGASPQQPSSRWQGDLIVRRWIVPDPFLIGGIREWRPGDAQRDVHWAATARTGRLQVKTHDYTASPCLLVVLNVQMHEHQWDNLMPYEQQAVENGISLAATVCTRALAAGLEAGFAANAPIAPMPSLEPVILMPAQYAGRDTDLLEAMARLRIVRALNFHTFLDSLGQPTGLDILVLSAYTSELIDQRLEALRHMGNSVALLPLGAEGSS